MINRAALYINGAWVPPHGKQTIQVVGAATGEVIGVIPEADETDAAAAVQAARAAFQGWSATSMTERLALIERLEEALAARVDDFAEIITAEVGTPLRLSKILQADAPRTALTNYRAVLPHLPLEEKIGSSLVVHEPIGVVVCITAWNYPLQQVLGKVGAALAVGCTVVVKPSEIAPLSAFLLADLIDEVGFPAGVFNLVSGTGPSVGEALVANPTVDMIHFTGSTRAGRQIGEVAARTVKRVALELGGKSANIILDDADLALAVKVGVANCFTNAGQTCTAWTRMLVPRALLAEIEELAAARAATYRLGDPLDANTNMGPLASARQQDQVREHITRALANGARLVAGGAEQPDVTPTGFFVAPTVLSDVTADMAIAQDEVFGPVLTILPYDTEDEAVEIANSTIYGLAGGVWSQDAARAERIARRMRAGQVDINGSFFNALAPFGGVKQSGLGRELGSYGLLEFYEVKSLQFA